MTEFQENSKVIDCRSLTRDVYILTLSSPQIAQTALPGQFVMIRVSDMDDPLLRRPFSIYDVSTSGEILILFKIVGRGTRLLSTLDPGDSVNVIGPLGNGYTLHPSGNACLVGGGMGIAPIYFLAKKMNMAKREKSNFHVILGARSGDELVPLLDAFNKFDMQIDCATDDGSFGHHGFVTQLLDPVLPNVSQVYVCGPTAMMQIVAEKCLEQNVCCETSLETHMACGLGACLGCTVSGADGQYVHVCKHGPVFKADEIKWEK